MLLLNWVCLQGSSGSLQCTWKAGRQTHSVWEEHKWALRTTEAVLSKLLREKPQTWWQLKLYFFKYSSFRKQGELTEKKDEKWRGTMPVYTPAWKEKETTAAVWKARASAQPCLTTVGCCEYDETFTGQGSEGRHWAAIYSYLQTLFLVWGAIC